MVFEKLRLAIEQKYKTDPETKKKEARANLENEARRQKIAFHINEWISSPGLQPPT